MIIGVKDIADYGATLVHDDGKEEPVYAIEYVQICGLEDGFSEKELILLRMQYEEAKKKKVERELARLQIRYKEAEEREAKELQPEPKYGRDEVVAYWGLWEKLFRLLKERDARSASGKSLGYIPVYIQQAFRDLVKYNHNLGFFDLNDTLLYRLELDLCSKLRQTYGELMKEFANKGEVVSVASLYKKAHAAA